MEKVTKIIGLSSRRIFLAEQLLEHPGVNYAQKRKKKGIAMAEHLVATFG